MVTELQQPRNWRLSLEIFDEAVEAVFYPVSGEDPMMRRRISIEREGMGRLQALEEAVYENPALLSDFDRVNIVFANRRYTLVPDNIGNPDRRAAAARAFWPAEDLEIIETRLPGARNYLLSAVDAETLAFVRRTFPTGRVTHAMAPMLIWFANKSLAGNADKMYVHLRPGATDIMCFSHGLPKVVDTITSIHTDDIAYYILLAAKTARLNLDKDEIQLCGDSTLRAEVTARLKPYARFVMPVVFPSAMYAAGNEAMQAPFELILLQLCG